MLRSSTFFDNEESKPVQSTADAIDKWRKISDHYLVDPEEIYKALATTGYGYYSIPDECLGTFNWSINAINAGKKITPSYSLFVYTSDFNNKKIIENIIGDSANPTSLGDFLSGIYKYKDDGIVIFNPDPEAPFHTIITGFEALPAGLQNSFVADKMELEDNMELDEVDLNKAHTAAVFNSLTTHEPVTPAGKLVFQQHFKEKLSVQVPLRVDDTGMELEVDYKSLTEMTTISANEAPIPDKVWNAIKALELPERPMKTVQETEEEKEKKKCTPVLSL